MPIHWILQVRLERDELLGNYWLVIQSEMSDLALSCTLQLSAFRIYPGQYWRTLPWMMQDCLVAIDLEWRPEFRRGQHNKVAMIQLASSTMAVLIRTCKLKFRLHPALEDFLRLHFSTYSLPICPSYLLDAFEFDGWGKQDLFNLIRYQAVYMSSN